MILFSSFAFSGSCKADEFEPWSNSGPDADSKYLITQAAGDTVRSESCGNCSDHENCKVVVAKIYGTGNQFEVLPTNEI